MNDRLFNYSIVFSFLIHALVIIGSAFLVKDTKVFKRTIRTIELTYEAAKKEIKVKSQPEAKEVQIIKSKDTPLTHPIDIKTLSKQYDAFSDLPEFTKSVQRVELSEKQMVSAKALGAERKISVPLLQSEKIINPKYLSYTQNIRQRIKQRAYFYADNPDFSSGEVYLTFILSSTGVLEAAKIVSEKTRANEYVQSVSLRSIQEAAPFPPFPPDLNFPELTFNVIISFELTEE